MTRQQQHTPGPWSAVQFPDEPDWVVIGPNGDERIATVGGNQQRDAEANARLIAAAPDLLAALQYGLESADAFSKGKDILDGRMLRFVQKARAAIAKANT